LGELKLWQNELRGEIILYRFVFIMVVERLYSTTISYVKFHGILCFIVLILPRENQCITSF